MMASVFSKATSAARGLGRIVVYGLDVDGNLPIELFLATWVARTLHAAAGTPKS